MGKEAEAAGETALDGLKQRVFASAFGSWNPKEALNEYTKMFEAPKEEPEYEVDEFVPETEADVQGMLNAVRRAGVVR